MLTMLFYTVPEFYERVTCTVAIERANLTVLCMPLYNCISTVCTVWITLTKQQTTT